MYQVFFINPYDETPNLVFISYKIILSSGN